jgi:hypothetical protein
LQQPYVIYILIRQFHLVQPCACIQASLWGSHGWYSHGTTCFWHAMPPMNQSSSTSYLGGPGPRGKLIIFVIKIFFPSSHSKTVVTEHVYLMMDMYANHIILGPSPIPLCNPNGNTECKPKHDFSISQVPGEERTRGSAMKRVECIGLHSPSQ